MDLETAIREKCLQRWLSGPKMKTEITAILPSHYNSYHRGHCHAFPDSEAVFPFRDGFSLN